MAFLQNQFRCPLMLDMFGARRTVEMFIEDCPPLFVDVSACFVRHVPFEAFGSL
jgi:hypothetical protein